MKTYNGGSVSNMLINLDEKDIWVTDTFARAARYANAQATGIVNGDMNQELAEGAVVLEVEANPSFSRRAESHASLDTCEDNVTNFKITKAIIRFESYENTVYGNRSSGYKSKFQVIELLRSKNIAVEIIS